MDPTSLVIEMLKQKQFITPLEQDILDTYHELNKKPSSVIRQSGKVKKQYKSSRHFCRNIG